MTTNTTLLNGSASIVSAYVGRNTVAASDIPGLIRSVHDALGSLGDEVAPAEPTVTKPTTAQIRKSITPDFLISFEDGKPYKTLKRHLTTHGLTIEAYKAKWGLPGSYPMTAPAYSEARSQLAKAMGLGQGGRGRKAVRK